MEPTTATTILTQSPFGSDFIKRFQHFQYLNNKKFQILKILKVFHKITVKQALMHLRITKEAVINLTYLYPVIIKQWYQKLRVINWTIARNHL